MAKQLVFIPISGSELSAIGGDPVLVNRQAYRVTSELLETLEYTSDQIEEAEYAALVLASVSALSVYGERLVLVAEVDERLVHDGQDVANGACTVESVSAGAMTCWFSEAPEVDTTDAAAAARGLDIDTAWGFAEVQDLLATADLLWNDVAEYRRGTRR